MQIVGLAMFFLPPPAPHPRHRIIGCKLLGWSSGMLGHPLNYWHDAHTVFLAGRLGVHLLTSTMPTERGPHRRASSAGTPLVQQPLNQSTRWVQEITFVANVDKEQSANIQITGSLSQFLSLLDIGKLNVDSWLTRRCPRFPCLQISSMQKNNWFLPHPTPICKVRKPFPPALSLVSLLCHWTSVP